MKETETDICAFEVIETVPRLMRFIRASVRKRGGALSLPQLRALGHIFRTPGTSLTDVADHLGVSKATASVIVDRLVQRELVNRAEDPTERRRVVLTLTASGSEQVKEVRQFVTGEIAQVLSLLPQVKVRKIQEGLALINEAFAQK